MTGTEHSAAEGYAGSYVAHHVPGERARLRTLETSFDPATLRVLGCLELPADAHCLDLGAGAPTRRPGSCASRPPRGSGCSSTTPYARTSRPRGSISSTPALCCATCPSVRNCCTGPLAGSVPAAGWSSRTSLSAPSTPLRTLCSGTVSTTCDHEWPDASGGAPGADASGETIGEFCRGALAWTGSRARRSAWAPAAAGAQALVRCQPWSSDEG